MILLLLYSNDFYMKLLSPSEGQSTVERMIVVGTFSLKVSLLGFLGKIPHNFRIEWPISVR